MGLFWPPPLRQPAAFPASSAAPLQLPRRFPLLTRQVMYHRTANAVAADVNSGGVLASVSAGVAGVLGWRRRHGGRRFAMRFGPRGPAACRSVADRTVGFTVEETAEDIMPRASAAWLDELMAGKDATAILLSGVEATNPVPGQPGLRYCFFPRIDVGPYGAQVRLTCSISEPSPGRVDIRVSELNVGIVEPLTGGVKFQDDPRELVEASSEVSMTWQPLPGSGGLVVRQTATQLFKLKMPMWFPVPDAVIEPIIRPFIARSIKQSQASIIRTLRQRLPR